MPEAQLEYAQALFCGEGVSRDDVAAVEWLEKAAKAGQIEASFELGARHVEGKAKTPFDEGGPRGVRVVWDANVSFVVAVLISGCLL